MLRKSLPITLVVLALMPSRPADAIEIRVYNATKHARFNNFPATPAINPNQLFAGLDLTGIGWQSNSADIQYTLVSRQHVVFATHFASVLGGSQIRFLNSSGQVISRTGPTLTTIHDGGQPSDLTLITLNQPIDDDSGIQPLPYLNLSTTYAGQAIGVAGKRDESGNKFPVIGKGTILVVESTPRTVPTSTLNPTRYMQFNYSSAGSADDCHFEVGDSGGPSFVSTNSRAALVGTHTYVTGVGNNFQNYDAFLPHYVPELDAQMASLGYRMRPVNFSTTTLTGIASTVQPTPRQALPLTLEFAIENTGANLTGNLEVEFSFPAGQAPDSISAAGWVTYGSGSKWTLRKATLPAAASGTLSASWSSAPIIAAITPTITWRSDTVADQSSSPSISLAPSYTAWASGLAEGALTDDPDEDLLLNQLEYALGGDPEVGSALLPNGQPLLPSITTSGGLVTYTYPERSDKGARGLSYDPEWSSDLLPASFSTSPPAGLSSSTAAYVPDVPGFVKRTLTWPAADPRQFVRLGISLAE